MEEKIKAMNLAAFKAALAPLEVIEDGRNVYVKPAAKADFLAKSTIDKIAGACILFGFSGYLIKAELNEGLIFYVF
jgi:hypothetical protein